MHSRSDTMNLYEVTKDYVSYINKNPEHKSDLQKREEYRREFLTNLRKCRNPIQILYSINDFSMELSADEGIQLYLRYFEFLEEDMEMMIQFSDYLLYLGEDYYSTAEIITNNIWEDHTENALNVIKSFELASKIDRLRVSA